MEKTITSWEDYYDALDYLDYWYELYEEMGEDGQDHFNRMRQACKDWETATNKEA